MCFNHKTLHILFISCAITLQWKQKKRQQIIYPSLIALVITTATIARKIEAILIKLRIRFDHSALLRRGKASVNK